MSKKFKDYPFAHSFVAGHAAQSSKPFNAREETADFAVLKEEEPLWAAADKALAALGKNHHELYSLGYQQAMGTDEMLEAPDSISRERMYYEYDVKLGIANPAIQELSKSLY